MAYNDELIWDVIKNGHCSFKTTVAADKNLFCRNPYSLTGLCNRRSCPLANSMYATVREEKGRIVLLMKTVERAHTPKSLWERVLLPRNYEAALEMISEQLQYHPSFQVHKCKQRLTKIYQYLLRKRKLRKKTAPKLSRVHKKTEQRESRREVKALRAAKLERSIEHELFERLKAGAYGDIYNFPQSEFESTVGEAAKLRGEEEEEEEEEEEFEMDEEDEEEDEMVGVREKIEMDDGEAESDLEDMDEALALVSRMGQVGAAGGKGGRKRREVEMEYEEEPTKEKASQKSRTKW